jgi:c-di-AMP phosphodiesterase-like protein
LISKPFQALHFFSQALIVLVYYLSRLVSKIISALNLNLNKLLVFSVLALINIHVKKVSKNSIRKNYVGIVETLQWKKVDWPSVYRISTRLGNKIAVFIQGCDSHYLIIIS